MRINKEKFDYQHILNNLSDCVFLFNSDKQLIYMNDAGEQLVGGSFRHFLNQTLTDILNCPYIDLEKDFNRSIRTGVAFAHRDLVITPTKVLVTVDFVATPVFEKNKFTSMLVEIQQLDRHLKVSREEQLLAQQNASRLLLRGLAHEVKNPLGGIRGAAQLLAQELDGSYEEYTQIIIDESDRLQALVERIVGPNKPPQLASYNIHNIVERVRQLVQAEAPTGVTIKRDFDPSIPNLVCDQDRLIQAILNIVRNASQAISEVGEIKIQTRISRNMTIGSKHHKLLAKIDVIDNGPGIPSNLIQQVFYPLVTGRPEGTGLGLSIAQSLISQHGGMIECTSEPGKTIFSIYLPLGNGNE
ncbi:MAG: nitrogen regulation protein NR(II) [Methylococcales bacterium]|nr:nitrogen regulation protein NR(II) [Methylococcales bacterium]